MIWLLKIKQYASHCFHPRVKGLRLIAVYAKFYECLHFWLTAENAFLQLEWFKSAIDVEHVMYPFDHAPEAVAFCAIDAARCWSEFTMTSLQSTLDIMRGRHFLRSHRALYRRPRELLTFSNALSLSYVMTPWCYFWS